MDIKQDFVKFCTKHQKLSSTLLHSYNKYQSDSHSEVNSHGMMIDMYSRLIEGRVVFLSTEINSDVSNIIKAQLLYLEQLSNDDINLYIDSPGGSVYSGLGLIDTIEYITPDVATINTGLAASLAAVILCCGTKGKRKSLKRSRTMLHQPLSYGGFLQQASDIEIDAREINSIKKELYEIISEKTGQPYDKVHQDSDRDYWMNSENALKYGMIDEIIIKRI